MTTNQKVTWSFSSLKTFKTCAKKYHAEKVLKLYPESETEASRYGKVVHSAFEHYLRDGTPLPPDLVKFQGMLDKIKAIPGELFVEHEMALLPDKTPCDFHDENRWVRGIADVLVVNTEKGLAYVGDHKTGSARYPDLTQLNLMALMVFAKWPQINTVKGALFFIHHNVVPTATYHRKDMDKMWKKWETDVAKLNAAYETDTWNPSPNGLCRKWCPVEHCEYNGG